MPPITACSGIPHRSSKVRLKRSLYFDSCARNPVKSFGKIALTWCTSGSAMRRIAKNARIVITMSTKVSIRLPNSTSPWIPSAGVVVHCSAVHRGQVSHPRPDPVRRTTAPVTMSKRLLRAVPTAVYKTQGVYWMGDSLFLRVTSIRKAF